MSGRFVRPVFALKGLLHTAALMVPQQARADWRASRRAMLDSLCVLAIRGELGAHESACTAWWCRDTVNSAIVMRWGRSDPRRWIRGPGFLLAALLAGLLLIGAASHGFAATRHLLALAARAPQHGWPGRVVLHLGAMLFAMATAAMASADRISLRGRKWRELSFLAVKMTMLALAVILVWVEGGAMFRSVMPNMPAKILLGGLLLTLAFIVSFDWLMIWGLADQHQRCPVCLRRLVMPVRIGSWASVFEPVATEWLCDSGHGLVSVSELEPGDSDQWTAAEPIADVSAEVHLR